VVVAVDPPPPAVFPGLVVVEEAGTKARLHEEPSESTSPSESVTAMVGHENPAALDGVLVMVTVTVVVLVATSETAVTSVIVS